MERDKLFQEEIANSITHGIGFLFSIAASIILIISVSTHADARRIISSVIYAISLVTLYAASTIYHYHSLPSERTNYLPNIIDYSAIYLFIAGSYTPFTLVTLRGVCGWSLFVVIWVLALIGIVFTIFYTKRFNPSFRMRCLIISYLIMGWLSLIAIQPVIRNIPLRGIIWIITGGILYSAGIIFLAWKKLPFHHAIWHLFVLGGSVCHYFAILFYTLTV